MITTDQIHLKAIISNSRFKMIKKNEKIIILKTALINISIILMLS